MTTLDDFEYQVFRIQPGDVVVLKAAREITAEEAARIRGRWVAEFPHIPVVVVGPDLDLAILRGDKP